MTAGLAIQSLIYWPLLQQQLWAGAGEGEQDVTSHLEQDVTSHLEQSHMSHMSHSTYYLPSGNHIMRVMSGADKTDNEK